MKEKLLDKLNLQWHWLDGYKFNHRHVDAQHEENILEVLVPNHSVKELIVERYRGTKFPNWLGDSHILPNLVSLSFSFCTNCVYLPPLGQLPSLQKLRIEGLKGIRMIGREFYGNGSSNAPFRCLSYLRFDDMGKWELWNICQEDESFPCLQELHILNCPRLTKSLLPHLPSLRRLVIIGCGKLETTLPKSSCMEDLYLSGCQKIAVKDMPTWSSTDVLPPLHDLTLNDCAQ